MGHIRLVIIDSSGYFQWLALKIITPESLFSGVLFNRNSENFYTSFQPCCVNADNHSQNLLLSGQFTTYSAQRIMEPKLSFLSPIVFAVNWSSDWKDNLSQITPLCIVIFRKKRFFFEYSEQKHWFTGNFYCKIKFVLLTLLHVSPTRSHNRFRNLRGTYFRLMRHTGDYGIT